MAIAPVRARRATSRPHTSPARHRPQPGEAGRTESAGRSGLTAVYHARPKHRSGAKNPVGKQWSRLTDLFRSSPMRCTGGMLLVSAVVFGLVLLNIHVAQTSFHLADLQRRASELQTEQRRLRYEVAKAEAPDNIVEMSSSLGLVPPQSQEYLQGPSLLVSDREPAGSETSPGNGESSR